MKRIIIGLFSPTWILADIMKYRFIKNDTDALHKRAKLIIRYNKLYLSISIVSIIVIMILQKLHMVGESLFQSLHIIFVFFIGYYFLSRCNEIFIAFLLDAIDKLDKSNISNSSLTYPQRLKLSLRSYLELILNFAIIFSLLPVSFWMSDKNPNSILESVYYSGVTITTLGYGDITANNLFPQLLSVYEVLCGFILLIVCFTIYTSREMDRNTN
jgi:voltage-gated potassium channel